MVEGEDLPKNPYDLKEEEPKEEDSSKKSETKKSEGLEVKLEKPKKKISPEKFEELGIKVDKLQGKLKLVALGLDKKSADLEIKISEADERFKDVAYDFPKLREKSEGIDSLLNVINLGLVDFKQRLTDINSRISKLEKVPEEVERRIVGIDNKLKKVDEDIKKLYLRLDEIGTIKQDVTKTLEEKIDSSEKNIRKEITDNKAEIAHLKSNLDALSFAIKSFERTIELTNLDDIIKRFDVIDRKTLNIQTELDRLRESSKDTSTLEGDVDVLKSKFKELTSSIMGSLSKINEFEVKMDKKLAKVETLERGIMKLNTVQSMTDTVIEQVKKMNEVKNSVEDLYGKIQRIYDSSDVSWNRLEKIVKELSELDKIKEDLKEVRKVVNENKSKIKSLKG